MPNNRISVNGQCARWYVRTDLAHIQANTLTTSTARSCIPTKGMADSQTYKFIAYPFVDVRRRAADNAAQTAASFRIIAHIHVDLYCHRRTISIELFFERYNKLRTSYTPTAPGPFSGPGR